MEILPLTRPEIASTPCQFEELGRPRSLRAILHAWPKIELHRHLEGSLRLETLADIAIEHGVDLPSYDIDELRPLVQVTEADQFDFQHFLSKFKVLRLFYTTREAVERIAYEAVTDAALDNVKYMELRFAPVALSQAQSSSYADAIEWVTQAVRRAQLDHDILVRLLVSVNRHEPETATEVIEAAIAYCDTSDIVGIDLCGDEVRFPIDPFVPLFHKARQAGLYLTVHAGEAAGAHNVRDAITILNADRIGHGVRTIDSSEVIQLVRERGVTLEVCPTSNWQTGVIRAWGYHPLPDLYNLGVKVTVNTDDPSISSTTLTDEYMVVTQIMQVKLADLKQMLINSAQAAFLPPEEKAALEARFRAELGLK